MALHETIRQLYAEKEKLERTIAALQQLQSHAGALSESNGKNRRGRKFMSAAERLEVSERMKKYWANRRQPPTRTPR